MAMSTLALALALLVCVIWTRSTKAVCTETCRNVDGSMKDDRKYKCEGSQTSYVQCTSGTVQQLECPEGQNFYPSIQKCEAQCHKEFTFETETSVFYDSCEPITYGQNGTALRAYPGDCSWYYWVNDRVVHLCHVAPGTAFIMKTQTFGVKFGANCTCKNRPPTVTTSTIMTTTTEPTATEPIQEKATGARSNTGAIAGGLIALVLVVVGCLGLVFFFMKRNKAREPHIEEAKPGIYRLSYIQSDTYDELREVEPPYDNNISVVMNRSNVSTLNRGPLPDAPDGEYEAPKPVTDDMEVGVYQDPTISKEDSYLEPGQLTQGVDDAHNKVDVNDNDSSELPTEVAPLTPSDDDVTDDASQDKENKGGCFSSGT